TTSSNSFVMVSRRTSAGFATPASTLGWTVLANELVHRLTEDHAVPVDINLGGRRRDQGHVVEWCQEDAPVEREEMHIPVELRVDRSGGFRSGPGRSSPEAVLRTAAEPGHVPGKTLALYRLRHVRREALGERN